MKNGVISAVAVIVLGLVIFIYKSTGPNVDSVINTFVKDINIALYQLESYKDISSAKCFRDGKNSGIIIEYTFSTKVDKSKINSAKAKENLIKKLRHQKDIEDVAKLGIYFLVRYKDVEGTELVSVKINPEEYK